jgi:hypothetical protein
VLQTQLADGRKKQDAPGFPIFPHSKRILEVPIEAKADSAPTELSLHFENFNVEEKLQVKTNNGLQLASGSTSAAGSLGAKP